MSLTRRSLLRSAAAAGLATVARPASAARRADRRFTMDLTPGAIGVGLPFPALVEAAAAHGFESVAPDAGYLGKCSDEELSALLDAMRSKGLAFGSAGLPVEFRRDDAAFRDGMAALPAFAAALERAGATRVNTWLMPNHAELTYLQNYKRHSDRLREVAKVLGDHGCRFGLEYVGPKTLWSAAKYPFVHTMAEARELVDGIGEANVGLVLDSWHWYTAHETADDIRALTNADVVACDLNDAPAGIPVDEQLDNRRALPASTGVIDVKGFLEALVAIGYDGPVRAEPFSPVLNAMDDLPAIVATAEAMKAAFAQIDG